MKTSKTEYWRNEQKADSEKTGTMRKRMIALALLSVTFSLHAQKSSPKIPKQNPDSVRTELKDVFEEMSKKHPGFYWYNDKAEFDAYIDSTLQTITEPIDELEIFRIVKPMVAKIGCLHTSVSLSEETQMALDSVPNHLPFTVYFEDDRAIVWKSFSHASPIKEGDEVLSINGKPIGEVCQTLLGNVPMDGFNQTGKYRLLQYTFPGWYRNSIEASENFMVELSNGSTHNVQGVLKDSIFSYSDIVEEPISLRIIDGIAIIKIPSFSNSYLKSKGQQFEKEINALFRQLEDQEIKNLLIDLRGNTGGTDSNPALLTSYFFDQPYRYWDAIEITEPLAIEVTGLKRVFYGKPKLENGRWLWSDKGLASKEFKFTNLQKPGKVPFRGEVFVLTDGLCMSSCADFVAIMQANEKATIIGEETGGGYQGNTSGIIPKLTLECGLLLDVPLLKYSNSVPKDQNFGRGTIPDIELLPRLGEIVSDEPYVERVIEAITSNVQFNSK